MALGILNHIELKGISSCVPKHKVSNADYDFISEKERKLLIKTTGIETRRIANASTCTSDLCETAAEQLIKDLNWDKNDIQIIILVTQTPDYITPATAVILQEKLGLNKNCLAFDINLGCSGYVYGLSVIGGLMNSLQLQKGLLLVGDVSSHKLNSKDKSTTPLFSDAGAATALEYNKEATPIPFNLQSDGKGYEAIIVPGGGVRKPLTNENMKDQDFEGGIIRNDSNLALSGLDIFNFTLREVAPNIKNLLAKYEIEKDSIDYFIFHQANLLLNESIRKKLKLDPQKVPYSLKDFGNTSSATIPLTICTELKNKVTKGNQKLLISGFGVGLSWGSAVIETKDLVISDLIEV